MTTIRLAAFTTASRRVLRELHLELLSVIVGLICKINHQMIRIEKGTQCEFLFYELALAVLWAKLPFGFVCVCVIAAIAISAMAV